MLGRLLFSGLCAIVLILSSGSDAQAAKKKKNKNNRIIPIQENDVFSISVNLSSKKKSKKKSKGGVKGKSVTIYCLDKTPGQVLNTGKGLRFKPFAVGKQTATRKKLLQIGKRECVKPDFLSLDPYRGPFQAEQAHTLFSRFAYGGNSDEIQKAVARGLENTVQVLMAHQPMPTLDAEEIDLRCDGYLAVSKDIGNPPDARNEVCDAANPNDFRDSGVRFDIYNRILYGPAANRFTMKLFNFLNDERGAASLTAATYSTRHAVLAHKNLLLRTATEGNYEQFLRDWNTDLLGHLLWLDGAENKAARPNENYAREFWELLTIGPTDLDGRPRYGDLDIAQGALAFTGFDIEEERRTSTRRNDQGVYEQYDYYYGTTNYEICYGDSIGNCHARGSKTVFAGTPYQAVVDDHEDMLQAVLAHPGLSEHLAQDLWKEFINPYPTSGAIKQLAKILRDEKLNLRRVLARIMRSRAVYAPRSRNSIIKLPMDYVFGFLIETGIPVIDNVDSQGRVNWNKFERLDHVLNNLSHRPLLPDTIFGFNELRLAGEAYVVSRRNMLVDYILNQSDTTLLNRGGFKYYDRFIGPYMGAPQATNSGQVSERIAATLNVKLTPEAKAHMDTYLNYVWEFCNLNPSTVNPSCPPQQMYARARDLIAEASGSEKATKIRGALLILAELPDYQVH